MAQQSPQQAPIDASVTRAELILKEARERAEKERARISIFVEHEKLFAKQVARIREDLEAITAAWRGFVPSAEGVAELEVLAELDANELRKRHSKSKLTGVRAVNPKYGLVIALVDEGGQNLVPRIRETIEAAAHPRPIEPFELNGFVVLSQSSGRFPAKFVFRGFAPKSPCACAPDGPGHRYQARDVWVTFGLWTFAPGETFDPPPKTEEELAIYMKAGRVADLFEEAKRAKEAVEKPPPPPPDPVEEAIKAFRGTSAAVPKPKDRQSGATTKEGRSQ